MKKKAFLITIICVLVLSISIMVVKFKGEVNENVLSDFIVPEKTKVILHFSTLSNSTTGSSPKPYSKLYYYNQNGDILGCYKFKEEVLNDFIVKGKNNIAFLRKNQSILSTSTNTQIKQSNSSINIKTVKFGPSQVGYLVDKNVYYSLLNVGKKSGKEYINVVRFTSEEKCYDISIPYYLENIAYDSEKEQFICIVCNIGDLYGSRSFKYIVLPYDNEKGEFVQDTMLHEIVYSNEHKNTDDGYRWSLAKGGKIYSVAAIDTDEYLNDTNPNKIRTSTKLVLYKYDLNNKTEEITTLKGDYKTNELGSGLLSGSPDLPIKVVNDKLYVFTSDKEVYIIEDENNIKNMSIPYEFSGSLSLKRPLEKKYDDKENFFGSQIVVGDNGCIYILNLYKDKKLKIHKLLEGGKYELVWKGELPPNIKKDCIVNTFEILP